jgi:hypothetical protein
MSTTKTSAPPRSAPRSLLHDPAADGILVGLAGLHALALFTWPSLLLVALGLWWNANTVSHYFIHRPFFRAPVANRGFSLLLSGLLGLPQSLWRDRHLAHHKGVAPRLHRTPQLLSEVIVVSGLWLAVAWINPGFFLLAWLPGIALGLGICAVHGHFEHVSRTISHYGPLYNALFFNDGYHIEHHRQPTADWRSLPRQRVGTRPGSTWPAVLRWLEHPLETLERLVLQRPALQRFVLATHRRAWRQLLPRLPAVRRVGIVGGGLFPRTATLLLELLPGAELTIIDCDPDHLALARARLGDAVRYETAWFDPGRHDGFDLLVFPLDFRGGDRDELQRRLTHQHIVCHEWLWRPRGATVVVSPWLLKRLNLQRAS